MIEFIIYILFLFYSFPSADCDETVEYFFTSSNFGSVDVTLNGAITSCDDVLRYEVHYDMQDVPDRFEVYVNGSLTYISDWFGDVDMQNTIPFGILRQGFYDHFVYLNGTWDFGPSNNIPSNYTLGFDIAKGKGRIFVTALYEDTVMIRFHSNEVESTRLKLRVLCKDENFIVRRLERFICYQPADTIEYVVTDFNCDTIIIDSIYVGDSREGVGPIRYDTVRNFPIPRPNDTIPARNDYGCWVPLSVTTYLLPNDKVYIPNIITPNGDGVNDLFHVNPPQLATYKIYDRWGNLHFSETTAGAWLPNEDSPSGVYTYLITIKTNGITTTYVGDVTLVR